MAADVLFRAMNFYVENHRAVPLPSAAQADEELVELPASVYARILLPNKMLSQNVNNTELARRMEVRPQIVQI